MQNRQTIFNQFLVRKSLFITLFIFPSFGIVAQAEIDNEVYHSGYKKLDFHQNYGLQFRHSFEMNDSTSKSDLSFFVLQAGIAHDIIQNHSKFSISPFLNFKFGVFFILTTGIKSGITFGINDKFREDYPVGFQISFSYDLNYNKYDKSSRSIVYGWCPESSLLIGLSPKDKIKISYGITLLNNNNGNHINNITLGYSGYF